MKINELEWHHNPTITRWLVGSVGVYIILVLNLLEPFGITIHSDNLIYHWILSSYGIISSLTVYLWLSLIQPRVKLSTNRSPQFEIIAGLAILVFVVSFSNWLYSQLLHYTISGWRNMYVPIRGFTELMPQFMALYSLWALLSWSHIYLMRSMEKQPLDDGTRAEQSVTLYSDNQGDSFKVKQFQVVCLKTCDNYLEVYYLNESNELQNRLIRSSMKKMQQCLDADHFYRSHQSYMVNLAYVKGLKKLRNNYFLEMSYLDFDVSIAKKHVKNMKSYLVS
jgi:hypothetical protein